MSFNLNLGSLPEKSVLLIEEDIGAVERIFLHSIVFEALKENKKVLYLAAHNSEEDIRKEMACCSFSDEALLGSENLSIEGYFSNLPHIKEMAADYDVCIIDSVSFLVMQADRAHIVDLLGELKKESRKENIIFLLAMDQGISEERTENILRAMVDGIIHFKEEHIGRKIERYVHIPKMAGRRPLKDMIPIIITESGIMVDTRETIM